MDRPSTFKHLRLCELTGRGHDVLITEFHSSVCGHESCDRGELDQAEAYKIEVVRKVGIYVVHLYDPVRYLGTEPTPIWSRRFPCPAMFVQR